MPRIFRAIGDEFKSRLSLKDTAPVNSYEGFTGSGAIVLRDRRGTSKAEVPEIAEKGFDGGNPLAIYKSTGAKAVSKSSKSYGELQRLDVCRRQRYRVRSLQLQLRLYQVKGDDDEEQEDHPLLTLLDGVNERMTGIELKYVTMSHLELTGKGACAQ